MINAPIADHLLKQHVSCLIVVELALSAAHGRVLREDVVLDRDCPPFDRATMDGIEIMTGAPLPEGCDAVIRYEDLTLVDGSASLQDGVAIMPGQNVHRRGADGRAGDRIVQAGLRLLPAHIASVGKAQVTVGQLPRIDVICTGDELVEVNAPELPHQIRQSNGHALRAALELAGYDRVAVRSLKDDETVLRDGINSALEESDVVLITGGVSAGRFDLVPKLLAELHAQKIFGRIRQKPGKPMWFGKTVRGQTVFGLPGNPVSSLVCFYRYVLPYLRRMEGAAPQPQRTVNLARLPERKNDFTHFVPVRFEGANAVPLPTNTSGDFLALIPSEGFVKVAPEMREPGLAPSYPWTST